MVPGLLNASFSVDACDYTSGATIFNATFFSGANCQSSTHMFHINATQGACTVSAATSLPSFSVLLPCHASKFDVNAIYCMSLQLHG